jgi:tetratricopeptide (TPR) repeat protein
VAIPRSVADQQDDAAGHEGWTSTAPGSSAWSYNGGGAAFGRAGQVAVSTAPYRRVGVATDQRPDLASQAVDQLQMLKFYAMMNQDERSMPNIRGLEETLSQLMQQFEYNKEPRLNAIQIFRSADEAIAAQRYLQAIDSLDQVVRMAPGSSLAFLAQFQIGRIAYEKLDDYDMAMNAFASCLKDYGTVSISADASRYIKNRLDLLTGTKADNWESLGAWKTALRATTAKDAVDALLKVVEKTAFQELAGDAAIRLRDYAIADDTQLDVDYETIRRVLQSRLASSTANRHSARIQFALAEITLYRGRDYDRAVQELRTAAAMNPDQDILRSIQLRLNQIGRRDSRVPEKQ